MFYTNHPYISRCGGYRPSKDGVAVSTYAIGQAEGHP